MFANLTLTIVIWEKETLRNCLNHTDLSDIFLIYNDEGGPSPLWAVLPLGRWSWVYKRAGWASHGDKTVISALPWFLPPASCLDLPGWWTVTCKPNKPLPPQLAFGQCFITEKRSRTPGKTKSNLNSHKCLKNPLRNTPTFLPHQTLVCISQKPQVLTHFRLNLP